jgi:uncharacterized protein (TIGR03905 family)
VACDFLFQSWQINYLFSNNIIISIQDVEILGGCNGNLRGISILVQGMHIDEIIPKLSGLPCGSRPTSCPDQLTRGLAAYLEAKQTVKA